jgi:predicted alpha/beta-hydrolase family hydrolase
MTAPAGRTWHVAVGTERTTVAWDPPAERDRGIVFVCAHGAGGEMNDRSILAVTRVLREHGIGPVRFNFLYRERRTGRPDPMPKLLECWQAVAASVTSELAPKVLVLGGRSMGGRAASMLVADGAACDGLLLLAYPLHPPGQPTKLRVEHLPRITVPVLCINGTRDPFCDPALMKQTLAGLGANWQMLWLDGADHSFHVLKSSGRTDGDVLAEVAGVAEQWVDKSVNQLAAPKRQRREGG